MKSVARRGLIGGGACLPNLKAYHAEGIYEFGAVTTDAVGALCVRLQTASLHVRSAPPAHEVCNRHRWESYHVHNKSKFVFKRRELVGWYFEPSQPLGIMSAQKTKLQFISQLLCTQFI